MQKIDFLSSHHTNFHVTEGKKAFLIKAIRGCKKETLIPKKIDNDIAYLLGVITGDGCISKEVKKYGSLSYKITIDSTTYKILLAVKRILKEKFGLKANIIKVKRAERLEIRSVPLALYLNKKFEIVIGKKAFKTKIPEIIKQNKNLTYSFLSGIIDTDFGKYGRTMGMSTRSKKLVRDLKEFFDTEGISYLTKTYIVSGKPAYHIWLNRKDIQKVITNSEKHSKLQNQKRKSDLISRGG